MTFLNIPNLLNYEIDVMNYELLHASDYFLRCLVFGRKTILLGPMIIVITINKLKK